MGELGNWRIGEWGIEVNGGIEEYLRNNGKGDKSSYECF